MTGRVLVVDDTSSIRFLLREVLPIHGFEVVAEAGSAAEGIELAESEQPDVVILDMEMPITNGVEAIAPIKERAPEARIILYSSHEAPQIRRDALDRGAHAYMDKLSPISEIASEMERLLQRRDDTSPV